MRQKNRFTRTGRYDRWLRLRRLAWLVPAFALVRVWMEFHTYFVEDIANAPTHLIGLVAVVCAAVMIVFIYSFIPFVLWWCVCTFFMSRSRREATFEPTSDLTYYRDTLKGLSAAQDQQDLERAFVVCEDDAVGCDRHVLVLVLVGEGRSRYISAILFHGLAKVAQMRRK